MPSAKQSMVLVGTRLSEVRGFSDFFSEFFTALRKAHFPPNMRMVVLCNRPDYELRAFQVQWQPADVFLSSHSMPHEQSWEAHCSFSGRAFLEHAHDNQAGTDGCPDAERQRRWLAGAE